MLYQLSYLGDVCRNNQLSLSETMCVIQLALTCKSIVAIFSVHDKRHLYAIDEDIYRADHNREDHICILHRMISMFKARE